MQSWQIIVVLTSFTGTACCAAWQHLKQKRTRVGDMLVCTFGSGWAVWELRCFERFKSL